MSNRFFDELPWYVSFSQTWGNQPKTGRWWKRRLSKARRRTARYICRYGEDQHTPYNTGLEQTVNWRNW